MQALECRTQREAAGVEADSWRRAELARGLWQPQGVGGASLLEAPACGKAMLLSHSALEGKGMEKGINLSPRNSYQHPQSYLQGKTFPRANKGKSPGFS